METKQYFIELIMHDGPPDEWYINEGKRQLAHVLATKIISGEIQGCYINSEIHSDIFYNSHLNLRMCRLYINYSVGKQSVVYIDNMTRALPMTVVDDITFNFEVLIEEVIDNITITIEEITDSIILMIYDVTDNIVLVIDTVIQSIDIIAKK